MYSQSSFFFVIRQLMVISHAWISFDCCPFSPFASTLAICTSTVGVFSAVDTAHWAWSPGSGRMEGVAVCGYASYVLVHDLKLLMG
jgi:hypothetical protein